MNYQRFLAWVFLLLPAVELEGQEFPESNFARYTAEDGLSHNTVSAVTQDSAGYIWITTASGINRYNGSRFVQFHSNNDSLSPASEEISGLAWLDRDRLAMYNAGVHIINTRTGETRNLFIPYRDKQYQYKFNMIEKALGGDNGDMYVLSRSGFYHFDKNYNLVSRFDYYSETEVFTEHFFFGRDVFELDNRRLLIVSIGGLYIYDKGEKRVHKMEAAESPLLAEFLNYPTVSYSFFQHRKGHLFVLKSASDSLVYVNIGENKKVVSRVAFNPILNEIRYRSKLVPVSDTLFYLTGHFSGFFKMRFFPESGAVKIYPEKYLRPYLCNALLTDRDNTLWVATSKGLFHERPGGSQVQVTELPTRIKDSFPIIRVDDIYVTTDKVYAASRSQGGLLIFDKRTLQFDKQIIFDKYKPVDHANNITSLAKAGPSTILLGTGWPLLLFDFTTNKERLLSPPVWKEGIWTSDLFKDSRGDIWIAAYLIYRYNLARKSFTLIPTHQRLLSVPFVIEEDKDGHIWMAGHGLARYNTVVDSFDLLLDSFPFIKMPDKQVNALVIDRQQNIVWFNSNNNGLIGYDINGKSYRHYTRKDGLPDDNIASMIVVGNKLWMACFSGIACMDLRTFQIASFGKEDGFPGMPVTKGARFFYDSAQHQLYLGFSNAIGRFNPYDLLRRKTPPHVFIESLVISSKEKNFLPGERITTSWRNNEIMITIGSINFSDGLSQGFAYRILKDSQTPWQQLGNQPSFSISNLSPGTYRIQVKVSSLNNRWPPQVKEISIVVLPPFWQKKWFVTLLAAVVVVLIYLLVRWRTGVARKKEMQKTEIQKIIADDYKSQFELEQISNYFSSSLAGKKEVDEVLWDVAGNLIGRMNYVDCMIYLWNEDKTKMIQKAAYGPKGNPEFISTHVFDVLPGQGVVGHVMETLQPVLIADTRSDERYRMDEMFRLSEICVPIIHNGELMGIIDSEHHEVNYFKERDLKILTTIATLIGNKLKQLESEQSLEEKQEELATTNEQLVEARLAALQAQMNPHFVFNALNSIKRMILDGDNEKASRYLSKFALMIRMTLNHSKGTFVTLDENIKYMQTYLEMEQLRFDESFTYTIYTGENIDTEETLIPSLMIQPLVENAIWHGLLPSAENKRVVIGFTQTDNKITCTIEDNGIGIRQSEKLKTANRPFHHSVGLENLQKRIKIINEKYHTDCSLEITDLKETGKGSNGTKVILRFNVLNI